MNTTPRDPPVPFAEALRVWVRVGLLSFGGPAAQIATMHRILVEEKRWIGEERFLHALNFCMLLPGPEATQLAAYIGWLLHRLKGGLVAGALFVLPGFAVMVVLSTLYAFYRRLPAVDAFFFGIKAAVLAIVVEALLRIGRRALKTRADVAIASFAFVAIFFFAVPFPAIVGAAALFGFLGARHFPGLLGGGGGHAGTAKAMPPPVIDDAALFSVEPTAKRAVAVLGIWLVVWFAPVAAAAVLLGGQHVLVAEGLFFSKMAVVTFGGAYAVLSYVAQQAVDYYGWLAPGEMLDGLGMAETTPGPLILVTTFVGYLAAHRAPAPFEPGVAAFLGAALTTWVTFIPSFLWIFLGAPYVEKLRGNRAVAGALAAITAGVVGVILNLAVWFALHAIFARHRDFHGFGLNFEVPVAESLDLAALVLAGAAMVAVLRFKLGMVAVLGACAAAGVAWRLWAG